MGVLERFSMSATPDPAEEPQAFVSVAIARQAKDIEAFIDGECVVRGMLDAAMSRAFWIGLSAADVERMLNEYRNGTAKAFAAYRAQAQDGR